MASRFLWHALLCLSTLQVLTNVEGLAGLHVKSGESLTIDTENSRAVHNQPTGSNQLILDLRSVTCSDNLPGSSTYDVAVLGKEGHVTFEKGSNIKITGNRSLSIESREGDVKIYTDIEMTCKTGSSNGNGRCLGAYTEKTCNVGGQTWYTGRGQWKPGKEPCGTLSEVLRSNDKCLPGASHGGRGGMNDMFLVDKYNILQSYGTDDVHCMSGGSAGITNSNNPPCFGGGAIEIKAQKGQIIIGSMISASAFIWDPTKMFTGCSGGLIRLLANKIEMENSASLKVFGADGGKKRLGNTDYAGNGGGAGGVIQIVASIVILRNISLAAGKPYICKTSYQDAQDGVLWIKKPC